MAKGRQRSWLGVTTAWLKSAVSASAAQGMQRQVERGGERGIGGRMGRHETPEGWH
jgi:hypothetical protein